MFESREWLRKLKQSATGRTMRTYAAVYLADAVLLASTVFGYRLAKTRFADEGFSDYALVKRALALLLPAMIVGLGVALPWHVAGGRDDGSERGSTNYLAARTLVGLTLLMPVAILALLMPDRAAWLLWSDTTRAELIGPTLLMLTGLVCHTMCYGYCRGRLWLARGSLLQSLQLGFGPLLLLWLGSTLPTALATIGLFTISTSVACLAVLLRTLPRSGDVLRSVRHLLRYGLPRVPGDIALAFLFYLPVLLASRVSGAETAGLVAYGMSLVMLMQAPIKPISVMLLPQATIMLREGRMSHLRRRTGLLLATTVCGTVVMIAAAQLATNWFLTLHLSTFDPRLPTIVRILVLAALPCNIHVCLRSLVDAGSGRALNARSAYFGVASCLLFIGIDRLFIESPHGALVAFVGCLCVMSAATCLNAYWTLYPSGSREPVSEKEQRNEGTEPEQAAPIPRPHLLKQEPSTATGFPAGNESS